MVSDFHEIRFPLDVAFGSRGGPGRRTDVVALASGREHRNSHFARSRRRYDAGLGVRTLDALHAVVAFFEERRGRLYGFRFRDRVDWRSGPPSQAPTPEDQRIGTGDGTTAEFPLTKTYGAGFAPYGRPIAKPVAGTVRVTVGGDERFDFACDPATGIVAFLAGAVPPDGALVTAGFAFDVPVRFDTDDLEIDLSAFAAGKIPKIPLVEIVPHPFPSPLRGGARGGGGAARSIGDEGPPALGAGSPGAALSRGYSVSADDPHRRPLPARGREGAPMRDVPPDLAAHLRGETLAAAASRDAAATVRALTEERLRFLQGPKTWKAFRRGWRRRVENVQAESLRLAAAARPPIRAIPAAGVAPVDQAAPAASAPRSSPAASLALLPKGTTMTDSKSVLASKTVWANLIGLAVLALGFLGVETGAIDQCALAEAATQLVAAASFIALTVFRVSATRRLT